MSGNLDRIVKCLEKIAPLRLAESWDNVGLLIEPKPNSFIKKIILTNDLTLNVMKEAQQKNVEMIISYHPPIFRPLKRFRNCNWKESIVLDCIRNNICLYSPHTALDSVNNGICDWIVNRFSHDSCLPIEKPDSADEQQSLGKGRYVNLTSPLSLKSITDELKTVFGLTNIALVKSIKHEDIVSESIKSIAVCPGSGSSLLVKSNSADLWITGEMSHHDLLDAQEQGISVILTCGHSNSERNFLSQVYCDWIKRELTNEIGDACLPEVIMSECDKDPINIL